MKPKHSKDWPLVSLSAKASMRYPKAMSPAIPDNPTAPNTGVLASLIQRARTLCRDRFGQDPEVTIAAPGRVNLIGEHVDYNDGFVLPMAIQRHIVLAACRQTAPAATFYSATQESEVTIPLNDELTPAEPGWSNYPRGVLAGFQARGLALPGFCGVLVADLPQGGGLSSSAALEVGTCRLLEALTGQALPELDCIQLCQKAEHTFAGVPCGIMDQFIVATAQPNHALLLDCQSLESQQVTLASDEVSILITNSGVAHELGKGEYAKRRADCQRAAAALDVPSLRSASVRQLESAAPQLDNLAFRRARHVITEIERTTQFAQYLQRRDWPGAGRLMYDSHTSLQTDYEVSCEELDHLVDCARSLGPDQGVYGSRLTGAGFGGCTVTLVRADAAETVRTALGQAYEQCTGIQAQSFVSPPAAGARRI